MSFAGLQSRLRKKATAADTTTTSWSSSAGVDIKPTESTTTNSTSSTTVDDVYEVAAREARANHETRKRQRSPHDDVEPVRNTAASESSPPAIVAQEETTTETVRPRNLTEAEFLARRSLGEEVMLQCAKAMSGSIESTTMTTTTTESPSPSDIKEEEGSPVYYLTQLPQPLLHFLEQRLQRSLDATAMSTAACEEEEYDLLCALKLALKKPCEKHVKVPPHLEALVAILRTIWLALCWHWLMSLTGRDETTLSEKGWSYNVYLLSRHALPTNVRNTRGRDVALALEAWKEAYRVRQNILDLLAYIVHDIEVAFTDTQGENQNSDADSRIIPVKIVESLFSMVQHLRRHDFAACRQMYVDLTMGTANWKLGLFSGGEVHMRRSMERIERRRIEHLLHNERAIRLLHVLRELMDFVQRNEIYLEHSGIFSAGKPIKDYA